MFVSFCLIVKYPWLLNQLSLNCGIVPGCGQTNDDLTSLMQICHNFLKLLDKMCKYEMDPASIVEDTERTRFCPQTDGRRETSIPPLSTSLKQGV